jgi:hypothetical protein
MTQSGKREFVLIAAAIIIIAVILSIPVLLPLVQRQIKPLSTTEELLIAVLPEKSGTYFVWIPVLKGSPFVNPKALLLFGAEADLVEDSRGLFLNVSAARSLMIRGHSSFRGALNESYLEYSWSGADLVSMEEGRPEYSLWSRAFATGNVTVIIRFDASSDYCSREDLLAGVLPGNGAWGTLAGFAEAVCA